MKKYLIRVLRKLQILKRISIYPSKIVAGSKFKIPIINEVGINNYLHLSEPWMQYILNRIVDSNKSFVDVGINLGQTLIKVKAQNNLVPYIGFEPNPSCLNYINEIIKVNNIHNTEIYPIGINSESTVLKLNLFSDSEHDSSASIIKDFRDPKSIKKSIYVPVFNLEDLNINTSLKVGVVKVDVEGAELEVLNGLNSIIQSDRPFILIEILPAYTLKNEVRVKRQNEIKKILNRHNYSIFRVMKIDEKYVTIIEIDSFDIHSDLNLCEYIFSPVEEKNELIKTLKDT